MFFIYLQVEWNPWLEGYRPQIPVLSALYPQLNLLNPQTPKKNSWVRHCYGGSGCFDIISDHTWQAEGDKQDAVGTVGE
jgi:hypothetical protein